MAKYEVLSPIALEHEGFRKEPGDTVTDRELEKVGQSEENIADLVACGALAPKA